MGIDRFARRRASDNRREMQARKATISRLQRLTDTTSVDYGTASGHDDEAFNQTSLADTLKRSSAQKAGA